MKHDKGCADSPNPPEDCECKCKRRYHGTGIYDIPDVLPESPYGAAAPPRRRKGRRALVITLALSVSAGTAIGLAASGTFGASSSGSSDLSVKVNVDLNKTISELSSLGYGGRQVATSGTTTRRTECAGSSTRQVRKFLIRNHCEQYQAQTWVITRRGATARVALSWVEMPTASLARQYKGVVDTYGSGNPPGVSSAFDGRCYASAQRGSTIQTVEVQATGKVDADRDILRAAAPRSLALDYLQNHCVI